MKDNSAEKKYFFDKSENVKRFIGTFYIVLIVLVVIDFFIPKHPHFPCEEYPSFYGAFGFVGCVGLVLVAKYILRPVVKRKENYYD